MAFIACPPEEAFMACPPGLDMPDDMVILPPPWMSPQQPDFMQALHMYSMAQGLAYTEAEGEECADGCVAEWDVQSTASGGSSLDQSLLSSPDRTPMSGDSSCTRGTSPGDLGGEINFAKILDGREKRTTCLIRNLPSCLTQYGLLEAIEVATFGQVPVSSVERIKLPVCRNGKGIGFAFVQFRKPTDVAIFAMAFQGCCWPTLYSYKVSEVLYAKTQGLPDDSCTS